MQCLGRELYWDPTSHCNHLQIGAGISSVPITDKVDCYYCIVRLCSFPSFMETICQGYNSITQRSLACEDGLGLTAGQTYESNYLTFARLLSFLPLSVFRHHLRLILSTKYE